VPIILPVEGVQVSTLAGADEGGSTDGAGEVARFRNPTNVALAPNGDMIVCDFTNGTLRRMTPDRVVSTALVQWGFFRPFGITYTPSGELYVQTDANASGVFSLKSGTIWKVDLDAQEATVVVENIGRPRGLTALPDGRLVLSDLGLHTVRIFDPTTKAIEQLAGESTKPGFVNGLGAVARFNSPYGAAVTPSGDILVADMSNHAIRRITIGGDVTTLAGDGSPGLIDGVVAQARFNRPKAVGVDDAGNIYVSDTGNHRFRRIDVNGNVMTLAGDGLPGFADGAGLQARFFGQEGFDVRPDGSALLVADGTIGQVLPYNRVRQILLP
jgi:streptogramin lyase